MLKKINPKDHFIELIKFEGEMMWFHGTSTSSLKKILASKKMKPFLADDDTFGEAVWFTNDYEEVIDFAKQRKSKIIAMKNSMLKKYKHQIITAHMGMLKDFNLTQSEDIKLGANLVVFEKISIKDAFLLQSKDKFLPLIKIKTEKIKQSIKEMFYENI